MDNSASFTLPSSLNIPSLEPSPERLAVLIGMFKLFSINLMALSFKKAVCNPNIAAKALLLPRLPLITAE